MKTQVSSSKITTEQWQHMVETYSQVTDNLELGIDARILETVVALNLLGISTISSCEGHVDHGTGAPWIDIAVPDIGPEAKAARLAQMEAEKQAALHQLTEEKIQELFKHAEQLRWQVSKKYLEARKNIMQYLTLFYADRHVPYDRQLILQGQFLQNIAGPTRLESQGVSVLALYNTKIRQEKLAEYQDEMAAFTHFLKQKLGLA
jgi:hypothetical protein